jgi:hypothetical protein
MKKEYIIVLLLIGFIIIMKRKARAQGAGTFEIEYKPTRIDWSKRTAKKGDYISKMLLKWTTESPEVKRQFDELVKAAGEKNALLLWTKNNAIANGKDWTLYDDKPSNNPLDPDSVQKGDKFAFFGPYSFEETLAKINEATNTNHSPIFYGNEVLTTGPNSQELNSFALDQWKAGLGGNAATLLEQFNK